MTPEEHKQRHIMLHGYLDELAADYFACTRKLPSKSSIMELIQWSHQQTLNPTAPDNEPLVIKTPSCPTCGTNEISSRERSPNGSTICANAHKHPNREWSQ